MIKQEGGEWIIDSKNSIILKGDIKIIEKGKKKFIPINYDIYFLN